MMLLMVEEIWRPIPGFDGYEASSAGRIRSVDRTITTPSGRGSAGGTVIIERRQKGKILSPFIVKCRADLKDPGYFCVGVGQHPRQRVHSLVALAFHGLPEDGQEVRHLNGNHFDNRVENLAWGTRAENVQDMIEHGTAAWQQKECCPRGHLLAEPNLIPSALRNGRRKCLACERARSYVKGHPEQDFQVVADSCFEDILAGKSNRGHRYHETRMRFG